MIRGKKIEANCTKYGMLRISTITVEPIVNWDDEN